MDGCMWKKPFVSPSCLVSFWRFLLSKCLCWVCAGIGVSKALLCSVMMIFFVKNLIQIIHGLYFLWKIKFVILSKSRGWRLWFCSIWIMGIKQWLKNWIVSSSNDWSCFRKFIFKSCFLFFIFSLKTTLNEFFFNFTFKNYFQKIRVKYYYKFKKKENCF